MILKIYKGWQHTFGAERVPYTVFHLGDITIGPRGPFHGNSFFTIHGDSRCTIKSYQSIFFPPCYENAFVTMWFDQNYI